MSDVEERLHAAFDAVEAPDALKRSTLARIEAERRKLQVVEGVGTGDVAADASRTGDTYALRRRSLWRFAVPIAACLALLVVIAGGVMFVTPTAVIGIDVNPSIELSVNRFEVVVGSRALNEDGQEVLDATPVSWCTYEDAATRLSGALREVAGQGAEVEVSVVCDDDAQYAKIEATSNSCLAVDVAADGSASGSSSSDGSPVTGSDTSGAQSSAAGVHCSRATEDVHEAAEQLGMGMAKYRIYQALVDAGKDVSAEECASMTMAQLRELAASLGVTVATDDNGACVEDVESSQDDVAANAPQEDDASEAGSHHGKRHGQS